MTGIYISWHTIPNGKSKADLKFNVDLCVKGNHPTKIDREGTHMVMCDYKVYKDLQTKFRY